MRLAEEPLEPPQRLPAFKVRATDTAGNADATPAGRTWTTLSSALYAACRNEEFGEEPFELLRDHHARPYLPCEECRVSLDERERWSRLEIQKKVSESIWSVNA